MARESCRTFMPSLAKRREKVPRCWPASTVVGTVMATCLPLSTAAAAAVHRASRGEIRQHVFHRARAQRDFGFSITDISTYQAPDPESGNKETSQQNAHTRL